MDALHSCRCCLRRAPDKELTTPYTHLGTTEIYSDMLKQCFDIHLIVDADYEDGICDVCVGRLRDARDFKLQVQRCQTELQARLLGTLQEPLQAQLHGALQVKGEEPSVKPEVVESDKTSENLMLHEEFTIKMELDDEDSRSEDEILYEEPAVKSEVSDASDDDCTSRQAKIIKKIDALHADVNNVKVSLASLQQQQNMNTIKIMTMLDNMSKHFQKAPEMRKPAGSAPDDDDILKKYALPLDNLTILKDLDRDLSRENYFTSMVKHFSSFVGADGQGRGEILGKKMAEQIMTRDLMTKMSWTGVSRTVEFERKFAFQTLENVVKLFHNVLLKADSRWSHGKNEKLFSGALLKHAKKRAIAEKEKAEKKKKTFKVGDNLTRVDNDTATPSNISATEAKEKPTIPSEISAPEARESSVDEDTK